MNTTAVKEENNTNLTTHENEEDGYTRAEMAFNSPMTEFSEDSDVNDLIKRMLAHIKTQEKNMSHENVPRWLREILEHLKTPEICNEAVAQFPYALWYVPDYLKTQEMCGDAVHNNPAVLFLVPDRFKTEEMCIKAVEVDPPFLQLVPDHFKTQRMCKK